MQKEWKNGMRAWQRKREEVWEEQRGRGKAYEMFMCTKLEFHEHCLPQIFFSSPFNKIIDCPSLLNDLGCRHTKISHEPMTMQSSLDFYEYFHTIYIFSQYMSPYIVFVNQLGYFFFQPWACVCICDLLFLSLYLNKLPK